MARPGLTLVFRCLARLSRSSLAPLVEVAPVAPTYNAATDTITIPVVAGVVYQIDGVDVTGAVVITKDTVVTAHPANGYVFPDVTDDDWFFKLV